MRKFILVTAMVLASATAQAGQSRNLSPATNIDEPPAATVTPAAPAQPTTTVADTPLTSPQYQPPAPPAPPAPPLVERPSPVTPAATTTAAPPLAAPPATTATTTTVAPPKGDAPRKSAKAGRRKGGYWTETRIIGELHRYGVYW
jgi:hypothetical protein